MQKISLLLSFIVLRFIHFLIRETITAITYPFILLRVAVNNTFTHPLFLRCGIPILLLVSSPIIKAALGGRSGLYLLSFLVGSKEIRIGVGGVIIALFILIALLKVLGLIVLIVSPSSSSSSSSPSSLSL